MPVVQQSMISWPKHTPSPLCLCTLKQSRYQPETWLKAWTRLGQNGQQIFCQEGGYETCYLMIAEISRTVGIINSPSPHVVQVLSMD